MRNGTEFIVCPSRSTGVDSGLSCGNCQSCEVSSKLLTTTAWFLKAGDLTKRKFVVGVLARCKNSCILENIRDLLNVTMGKDFTYARSRVKPGLPGDTSHNSSDRALDPKLLRHEINQTWDWFIRSSDWTKSNYLMGIMSFCDTGLLHILGNLAHVLVVREKRCSPFRSALGDLEDEVASIPESHYTFSSNDNPHLELFVSASSVYGAVDLPHCCPEDDGVVETATDTGCGSLTSVSGSRPKEASYAGYESKAYGYGSGDASDADADSAYSDDPALTVMPESSHSLSGVGRHRDFIRQLPVHIAKRILGLLDSTTLHSCLTVSRHWRYLSRETQEEGRVKQLLEIQAMLLQGKTKAVNPTYARFQDVLVAVRDDEKFMYHGDSLSRSRKARVFEAEYAGVITKCVQMEERNVFCGTYNILLLCGKEDPSRVIHYGGGQLVALCSKDRVVRLVDVVTQKEVLPTMFGHTGSVRAVLLCEDRGLIISAGYDLSIRCWNIKTGACTNLLRGHMGSITCLDAHGNRLVSGAKDCKVKVWDLVSGRCVESLKFKHQNPVLCVRINKSFVLSSCAGGQVKMWSLETASLLKVMEAHKGSVGCLFFDEWHIVTGGVDGQVMAWSANPDFKKCLMTYHHPKKVLSVTSLYLRVITGCVDGNIRIFNFFSGECIKVIKACCINGPLHSLHVAENNMVVNADSGVYLLQFARVSWDYAVSLEHEVKEPGATASPAPESMLRKHPDAYVRAERMAAIGSSSRKLFQHGSTADDGGPALMHCARSLSAASMQRAMEIQQESMRMATWHQVYKRSRFYGDLQPNFMALSGHSQDPTHTPSSMGRELGLTSAELSRSEKALLRRVRKQGAHRPPVPEHGLNARMRDAWGTPPPSRSPPNPNPDPNRSPASLTSPSTRTVHGSGRVRPGGPKTSSSSSSSSSSSPPPLVEPRPQPHFQNIPQPSIYKRTSVIYTPLRHLASSEPNVQQRPDPRHQQARARLCTTSLGTSRVKGRDSPQPPQRKRPQTAGPAWTAAGKVGPLRAFAPNHSAPTPAPALTPTLTPMPPPHPASPSPPARPLRRGPNAKRVEFESPSPPKASHHNPLDPYREHGGFQLRTPAQLEEYVRQQMERGRRENARGAERGDRSGSPRDPSQQQWRRRQRRRMTVWGRRVRGLPHQDFSQERQVYAPELGPDVYI
ncbi:hypothetical protein ACEWY4_026374 [Coilia grayii]|uniref:F-box domain-containing protein n=1 Tax=Coilia grayii TaxID=363190 RepID=A0ABD1IUP0_9TELE